MRYQYGESNTAVSINKKIMAHLGGPLFRLASLAQTPGHRPCLYYKPRICNLQSVTASCSDSRERTKVWVIHLCLAHRLWEARKPLNPIEGGQLRPVENVRLAARFIIETVATWAIHIKWDHSPESFDPQEARNNAIEFVVEALAPKPQP